MVSGGRQSLLFLWKVQRFLPVPCLGIELTAKTSTGGIGVGKMTGNTQEFLAVCFGGDFLSGLYELLRNRQKCIRGKITGASGTANAHPP